MLHQASFKSLWPVAHRLQVSPQIWGNIYVIFYLLPDDVISLLRINQVFPVDIRTSVFICLCNHTKRQTDKYGGEELAFSRGTHPDWATAQFSLTVPSPSHWSHPPPTHTHTMTHAHIMSAAYSPLLLSNIHSSQYSSPIFPVHE